jgi:hypothetical protein
MSLPRVKVQLRLDRDRTLVLSFNALCLAEEVTGINFLMGEVTFSSLRVMRALVWAGLLDEDPTLTLAAVGDMIEEAGADKVANAIISAYHKAMPDADEEGDGDAAADPQKTEEVK